MKNTGHCSWRVQHMSIQASAFGATAPAQNDSRIVYSADPRIALASHNKDVWVNVESVERSITTLPEPGYLDPNKGQFDDNARRRSHRFIQEAFRHKILQGMAYRQDRSYQSARAEVDARWRASNNVYEGVPYWAVVLVLRRFRSSLQRHGRGSGHPGTRSRSDHTTPYLLPRSRYDAMPLSMQWSVPTPSSTALTRRGKRQESSASSSARRVALRRSAIRFEWDV